MHHHVTLWCTVHIVTTEDLSDSTALGIVSNILVQFYRYIAKDVGRLTVFSQTTAKNLFHDTPTSRTDGCCMERGFLCISPSTTCSVPVACLRVSQGTTAINILMNQTTSHIHSDTLFNSTRLTTTKDATPNDGTLCGICWMRIDVHLRLTYVSQI